MTEGAYFKFRSKEPPFNFSMTFTDTISVELVIEPRGFFQRLKEALMTVFGYSTECCINLTGEDAKRLKNAMAYMLENSNVENSCNDKPVE